MSRNIACVLLVLLLLTACARSARLYPANDVARPQGVLTAKFMAYGTGHGSIEIALADGEILKGEYSIVRGGSMGFGSVYASVYGPGGSTSGTATGSSYAVEGGSAGAASLFGDRNTSMDCEFYNDNFSGHGRGACRSSLGGLYRLQY